MIPKRRRHTGDDPFLTLIGAVHDGDGGAGSAGGAGSGDGTGAAGGDGGDGGGDGTGSGGDGDGDTVTITKAQHDALQSAVAKSNQTVKRLEKQINKAAEGEKAKAGEHEELYNDTKAELERVTKVVGANAVTTKVAEVAKTLGYRNPAIAHKLISTDGIEADVDLSGDSPKVELDAAAASIIEARLKAALDADPYLKGEAAQRQLPGARAGPGKQGGGDNAEMNAQIRRAAGRG